MTEPTVKVRRERGSGRIYQRGRMFWVQYYRNGLQIRESAETTDARKALKFLQKKTGAVANGIVQDSRSLRYENVRAAYLCEMQLTEKKSLRRDRAGEIYTESVRRLDSFFGGFRAVDINADLIQRFQLEQQSKGLANGSINRSVASLRKMFTLAQRQRKVGSIPFFEMLPEAKPRQGTLPHEKYAALINELPHHLQLIVGIAFHTGMRRGEIVGLTWSNIQWMERIIRIEDSKNGEPREIPFGGELEKLLRQQYAKRQEGCDCVCFRVDAKGHARPTGNFRKVWSRVCIKLGLGQMEQVLAHDGTPVFEMRRYAKSKPKPKMRYTGLVLHDLRRTFVTDAEHSGAPRHEVMKISGHRSESVYKRYAIENREQRRAALAHIEEYRAQKFGDNSGTVEGSPSNGQSVIN